MDPNNNPIQPTPTPAPTPMPTPAQNPMPAQSRPTPVMSTSEAFENAPAQSTQPAQPTQTPGIFATEPITQPEPAPAPDPVEEALKAPFQAAAPVPGSIGSAISVPSDSSQPSEAPQPEPTAPEPTQNISFNDPATTPNQPAQPISSKKTTSRGTLIALCVVAAILVAGLGVLLYMSLNGYDIFSIFGQSTNPSNENQPVAIEDNPSTAVKNTTVSCVYNMTDEDLAEQATAKSGKKTIELKFNDDQLSSIMLTTVITQKEADADPVTTSLITTAELLTEEEAADYLLTPDKETGGLDLSYDAMVENYTALDFVCEKL